MNDQSIINPNKYCFLNLVQNGRLHRIYRFHRFHQFLVYFLASLPNKHVYIIR